MTAMQPLRDILNNTPADAVDVDWNFGVLETHIGAELVNRDGSVAMTGPLSLPGPPTAPQHAATKAYVDGPSLIPVGTIWEFAGVSAPAGWAFCDGSDKSTTDPAYAALFAVIGYRHGGAGGTFKLPDRRNRVAVGFSSGDALFGTLGARGGNRNLIIPNHTHPQDQHQHGGGTNQVDTNHYHHMANHQHYVQHQHDSGVRHGYSMNIAGQPGSTNAVYTPAMAPYLDFHTRPSALCTSQEDGANHQNTGWAINRDWSDPPNNPNTGWQHETNGNYLHSHTVTTDFRTPTIQNATGGSDPTNANYPLYEVVNYIVRIG